MMSNYVWELFKQNKSDFLSKIIKEYGHLSKGGKRRFGKRETTLKNREDRGKLQHAVSCNIRICQNLTETNKILNNKF